MMMNIAIFDSYYEWERFAKIVTRDTFIDVTHHSRSSRENFAIQLI